MGHLIKASCLSIILGIVLTGCAQNTSKPTYSANVPASLITADKIDTQSLGELYFNDGMPNPETVEKAYDYIDLSRAVDSFLDGMPAASIYAMLEGQKGIGLNRMTLVLAKR